MNLNHLNTAKKPMIAVPITANNLDDIKQSIIAINNNQHIDLVEWRVDFFNNLHNFSMLKQANELLKKKLKLPLLITFRTVNEGGHFNNSEAEYFKLLDLMIAEMKPDLLDVELAHQNSLIKNVIQNAHQNNILVIESNHDFNRTPVKLEMCKRLVQIQNDGADIAKIAYMPKDNSDVLNLMKFTDFAKNNLSIPIVSMSMGNLGKITRLYGYQFGSCITFASLNDSSAPGQLTVDTLNNVLKLLNE
ncbi:type I 3-dehydroquinate dehydratase [Apilactobacillus timberlakei]|uniref:3-dehydroquinate dehydratase n=1 Tax=Apilactobacillus timberlakei TaxID=2008380 RepID=A0ABY2YY23_9LACO|nr:type I 3-dehydroquinate dehydratase [Apilactobacillus timberlakei]TPR14306.1 type I 3-dehydroquinate dehydratase [Apilactobacillus timberlakei]TPR16559.1 type I 3-dehydroquinate dehydratase [Apilactobacillus timberlakei]